MSTTTSPISVRVNSFNRISECTDQTSTRWSMTAVQLIPVCEQTEVKVGIDNTGKPTTELQPTPEVYAVATDGRQLAITKLDGLATESQLCPASLLEPHKPRERKTLELNGQWKSSTVSLKDQNTREVSSQMVEGRFPPVESVLPDITSDYVSVTIDVEILRQLVSAINQTDKKDDSSKVITLLLSVDDEKEVCGPIGVVGNVGFGVIMPATTNQEKYIGVFQSHVNRFKDNLTANTPERQAQVLALLNPENESLQAAAGIKPASELPTATVTELDPEEWDHKSKYLAIRAAHAGIGDVCLFPIGSEYFVYAQDAEPVAKALGLPLSVEWEGSDHELQVTSFQQSDLVNYFNQLGKANLFIKVMQPL